MDSLYRPKNVLKNTNQLNHRTGASTPRIHDAREAIVYQKMNAQGKIIDVQEITRLASGSFNIDRWRIAHDLIENFPDEQPTLPGSKKRKYSCDDHVQPEALRIFRRDRFTHELVETVG